MREPSGKGRFSGRTISENWIGPTLVQVFTLLGFHSLLKHLFVSLVVCDSIVIKVTVVGVPCWPRIKLMNCCSSPLHSSVFVSNAAEWIFIYRCWNLRISHHNMQLIIEPKQAMWLKCELLTINCDSPDKALSLKVSGQQFIKWRFLLHCAWLQGVCIGDIPPPPYKWASASAFDHTINHEEFTGELCSLLAREMKCPTGNAS